MLATPSNMKKVAKQLGVFAFSPNTGEEYSANPRDYWDRDDNTPLYDMEDEPMILVRKVTKYEKVEDNDDD